MKYLLEKHWIYTVNSVFFTFLMFMCNLKSIRFTVKKT